MSKSVHDEYGWRERLLERSVLFNFVVHGLALVGMALVLIPFMPGGPTTNDDERIRLIADHPWLFRLGWAPWQGCAVADGFMAVGIVAVRWIPRVPAWLVFVLTAIAIIPDQYAQAMWITEGVRLAQQEPAKYLAFERQMFPLTAAWAALLYTLGALGWTWCFIAAKTWSRTLSILSVTTWLAMGIAVTGPLLPENLRPSSSFVATANGFGFIQLQLWLGLVTEEVLRRARPFEPYGRLARWKHPRSGIFAWIANTIANSRLFGYVLEPLPEVAMRSDIKDVIYVNYLVPAERLQAIIPHGLELQTVDREKKWALFTFLTFRHGNFGAAFLGPLRKFLPSPIQTNWRIHVLDPVTKHKGIYFTTNAITSTLPALGARLFTEGMPMHVLERAEITRDDENGQIKALLDPGEGSGPDAKIDLSPTEPNLEGEWRACFETYEKFLAYCVPQDRAMASQPLRRRVSRQEIDLGIPLDRCEPLVGSVVSKAARALVGPDAPPPVCFRVAAVTFNFSGEHYDRRPSTPPAKAETSSDA